MSPLTYTESKLQTEMIEDLRTRLRQVTERVTAVQVKRSMLEKQVQVLMKELQELSESRELLSKVDQVLMAVSATLLGKSVKQIDRLVTIGLQSIFADQALTFSTKIDKSRGKTALQFELSADGVIKPLTESYGGGVLVVIGVLLRVVIISILKMRKILLLDESFANVSEEYVPAVSKFLTKVADQLGFDILLVTHQPEFASSANIHYHGSAGPNNSLQIKRVK